MALSIDATVQVGMEKPMHLPSAGMIRFRFNGSAFASQAARPPRGIAKDRAMTGGCNPELRGQSRWPASPSFSGRKMAAICPRIHLCAGFSLARRCQTPTISGVGIGIGGR